MMRRYLAPALFGLIGVAILLTLGTWQLRRMTWKQQMLAEIQRGIDAPGGALPAVIDPSMKYRPVETAGRTTGDEILVLSAGRVVEAGTHADLLRGGGAYARLAGSQLALTA